MTRPDLAGALAGIARVMGRYPDSRDDLAAALILLSESLAGAEAAPLPARRQRQVERLAELERLMRGYEPGDRINAVMTRMAIGRTKYFALRAEAIDRGLMQEGG